MRNAPRKEACHKYVPDYNYASRQEITMKRGIAFMVICAATAIISAFGQHGTAPKGYYPSGYGGDIFTGVVKAVDATQQSLTLVYEGARTPETFTARLENPCIVPSQTGRPMTAADIEIGTNLTVFYSTRSRKVEGRKQTEKFIIAITFNSWKGREVKDRRIFYCIDQQHQMLR